MTATREQIIAEARTWLGTPWHHQARLKGVGVDCIGLAIGVAKALGLSDYDIDGYGMQPDVKALVKTIESIATRIGIADARPGDMVLINFAQHPQHLGILTDKGIIHALSRVGFVAEHRLSSEWRKNIWRAYRFPGIED